MAHKLDAEDSFPDITLNLVGGSTLNLPGDLESNYSIVLFYRGHWQPYCRRQLADFEKELVSLDALDAKVYPASVEDIEKASEIASGLSFPVGHGVTREDATKLDFWWEDRRSIIQPSEFILDENGTVLTSTYSSGPIGRMLAVDAVKLITLYESRK